METVNVWLEDVLFARLQVLVEMCVVVWALTMPLLLSRRIRPWIGLMYIWSSYLTGFTCWIFSVIVAYRTLGLFWLIFGVLAGGIGVFPIALVGAAVRSRPAIPNLLLALAMMVIPRFIGIWIVRKYEESEGVLPA